MNKCSVVIITFNAEADIARCINSVKDISDDIIVVDSFSTDSTPNICQSLGVRFIQRKWDSYGPQKNFGNQQAKYDWILSIDADEAISKNLAKAIKETLKHPKQDAYALPFMSNYCGRFIKHGKWYPEKHVRLFNKQKVTWNTDDVHEALKFEKGASIGKIKTGHVFHYTIKSVAQHFEKAKMYSSLGAEKMHLKGKKATFLKRFLNPFSKFFIDYFFRLGFLDGYYGLCIAYITSYETYLKYDKLFKLNKN